jgi:hypothetical protein
MSSYLGENARGWQAFTEILLLTLRTTYLVSNDCTRGAHRLIQSVIVGQGTTNSALGARTKGHFRSLPTATSLNSKLAEVNV